MQKKLNFKRKWTTISQRLVSFTVQGIFIVPQTDFTKIGTLISKEGTVGFYVSINAGELPPMGGTKIDPQLH